MMADNENVTAIIEIPVYIPKQLHLPYIVIQGIKKLSCNTIQIVFTNDTIIVNPMP